MKLFDFFKTTRSEKLEKVIYSIDERAEYLKEYIHTINERLNGIEQRVDLLIGYLDKAHTK